MSDYFRPLVQVTPQRPEKAMPLAGGWGWFTHMERLSRTASPEIVPVHAVPEDWLSRLTGRHSPVTGLDLSRPVIMGILNVTPDSFSDGGRFDGADAAVSEGVRLLNAGADILDIGGESTRPGATLVPEQEEIARTAPVIAGLRRAGAMAPISIDTRKAAVATESLKAGADLVNDVSGFTFDPGLAPLCRDAGAPICVMHAQGDPATMQQSPHYDNVLLDVLDFLERQILSLTEQGIRRENIIADPGIGFGKTLQHNLQLLTRISLFHGLGVPILLGASRKKFIGTIGRSPQAQDRMPGSVAVALAALAQGVQIMRVHDVFETRQAFALWDAVRAGEFDG